MVEKRMCWLQQDDNQERIRQTASEGQGTLGPLNSGMAKEGVRAPQMTQTELEKTENLRNLQEKEDAGSSNRDVSSELAHMCTFGVKSSAQKKAKVSISLRTSFKNDKIHRT